MAERNSSSGADPKANSGAARGVFLTVDDIDRLVKSFGQNVARSKEGALRSGNCGVIICGNGESLA
jgi:hypothetical protein